MEKGFSTVFTEKFEKVYGVLSFCYTLYIVDLCENFYVEISLHRSFLFVTHCILWICMKNVEIFLCRDWNNF